MPADRSGAGRRLRTPRCAHPSPPRFPAVRDLERVRPLRARPVASPHRARPRAAPHRSAGPAQPRTSAHSPAGSRPAPHLPHAWGRVASQRAPSELSRRSLQPGPAEEELPAAPARRGARPERGTASRCGHQRVPLNEPAALPAVLSAPPRFLTCRAVLSLGSRYSVNVFSAFSFIWIDVLNLRLAVCFKRDS